MFPVDLEKYPLTEMDLVRVRDLMRILPKGGRSALDVGALWGYFSEFLSSHYGHVTALDLEKPQWELPRVTPVAGDITRLQFPDNTFDLVFCAEVLEHIPQLTQATSELARVTRKHLVIGVPFEQDLRLGRLTCIHCGRANPGWGHVNSFTESKLKSLFPGLRVEATSFVYPREQPRTNPLSRWLFDLAGNPYGDYEQLEGCMYCHRKMDPPGKASFFGRGCAFIALRLNRVQALFAPTRAGWIHVVFRKDGPGN